MSFIISTGHDFAADYWSYGVLIYELLTRNTPFYARDDMTVYENILNGIERVKFSKRVSKHAEVNIQQLFLLMSIIPSVLVHLQVGLNKRFTFLLDDQFTVKGPGCAPRECSSM